MANKVLITVGKKTYRVVGNPIAMISRQESIVKSVAFMDKIFNVKEVSNC